MRNIILLFLLIVGCATSVYSQNEQTSYEVTGIVTDVNKGPLVGVNVTAKNIPGFGTVTDINGRYRIKVPHYSFLIFSFVINKTSATMVGFDSKILRTNSNPISS